MKIDLNKINEDSTWRIGYRLATFDPNAKTIDTAITSIEEPVYYKEVQLRSFFEGFDKFIAAVKLETGKLPRITIAERIYDPIIYQ